MFNRQRLIIIGLLAYVLLLLWGCSKKTPSDPPPPVAPSPRKSPTGRFDDIQEVMLMKRKYIPREVWDITGSPDLFRERDYLKKALNADGKNPEILYLLGFNYMEDMDYKKAVDFFRKTLEMDPHYALAWEHLAMSYLAQEEWDKAEGVLKKALQEQPDNPRLTGMLGRLYLNDGARAELAMPLFEEAVAKGIRSPYIYEGMADALLMDDKEEEAEKYLRLCIDQYPGYTGAPMKMAELHFDRGNIDESIKLLKDLTAGVPSFNEAHRFLGEVYLEKGDYEQGRKYLEEALNSKYKTVNENEIRLLLAELHIRTCRYSQALQFLKEVMNDNAPYPGRNMDLVSAYSKTARIHMEEGRLESAEQELEKAQRLKKDNEEKPGEYRVSDEVVENELYTAQARYLTEKKDFSGAEKVLEGLIKEENDDSLWLVYFELARVNSARGSFDRARILLEKAEDSAFDYQKKRISHRASQDKYLMRTLEGTRSTP